MSKKKTVFNYELTYSKDAIVKYLNDLKKEVLFLQLISMLIK